ncbi:MAG TPA: Ig-like domain-containing protein, partial [Verrucomicrobiae bacterium]
GNQMSGPGLITAGSFGVRADFGSGWNPNGIGVGDLDGDGRPDVVIGNLYDGNLSLYQNATPLGSLPKITNQPANLRVTLGYGAAFNVASDGTTPLLYQWFKGYDLMAGKTNSSFAVTNAQLADFTNYWVVVGNRFGSVTSSVAALAQNHRPVCPTFMVWQSISNSLVIPMSSLLANVSDVDGDFVSFNGAVTNSSAGGTVQISSNNLIYLAPFGYTNSDMFAYQVADGYAGGLATGYVVVQAMTTNGLTHTLSLNAGTNGSDILKYVGVPGTVYRVQYQDGLLSGGWIDLSTNLMGGNGVLLINDYPPANVPMRFYRVITP